MHGHARVWKNECASMGEVVLGCARVSEGVQGHEKACKCVQVHVRNVRMYKSVQEHVR